jgi:hypothetical protein
MNKNSQSFSVMILVLSWMKIIENRFSFICVSLVFNLILFKNNKLIFVQSNVRHFNNIDMHNYYFNITTIFIYISLKSIIVSSK